MLAIEESASIFCAREMRGTLSIARTVTFFAARLCSRSGFCAGQMKLTRIWPSRMRLHFLGVGRAHLEDDVGAGPHGGGIGNDLGAGGGVGLVGDARRIARARTGR